jgi:hypothetical protein
MMGGVKRGGSTRFRFAFAAGAGAGLPLRLCFGARCHCGTGWRGCGRAIGISGCAR